LDETGKHAVKRGEKYDRHALNVVRRRIASHVRDFRKRSEEVGRVLYLKQCLSMLHSDFEKVQKHVLRDEASGERKELSSVIKESSEVGRLCATRMCELVRETQRAIVAETSCQDLKKMRDEERKFDERMESDIRESLKKSISKIVAKIRSRRQGIRKKHRNRVSELRVRYTKEAERVQTLFDEGTAKKYGAMAQKSIEALLDWAERREDRVASADERRVREVMTTSFDQVLETMRKDLKQLEAQCRADVKIVYDAQIARVEKIESGHVRCRFLEDEVSFYKYLVATEAEAEKHESVQVSLMSHRSEILLSVVNDFLTQSVKDETLVTSGSELERIRSVCLNVLLLPCSLTLTCSYNNCLFSTDTKTKDPEMH